MPLRRRSREKDSTTAAAGVPAPAATTKPAAVGAPGELRAGVDLGGTKIEAALFDDTLEPLA